ncbi:structural protein /major capsid protein [Cellulophaga phage Calle_1]|uniref:Structural protein /major capsid protein n=1 Tax=Cellulophaga phage Calle_1 TaxID=2745643 RepID=A0A8E4ZBB1_9CAUD|nr:virion structural protein [Cellulophaga phage Calle_1]QQV89721.1 structural protein /major capsid protein [Cellulophaga phage Calle_1]QQV89783.1 structural protein [Cellulophaga phage Calle_2]QQV89936.1 structural protein [Cellulophaga phage Calle_3]
MALTTVPSYQISPSSVKAPSQTNYIDVFDYTNQFAPDAYEELVSIYGDQSLTGMIFNLGSEEAISSDQYIWTEKGRLHTSYESVARTGNVFTQAGHVFRIGEVVACSGNGSFQLGRISAITPNTFTALPYKAAGWSVGATGIKAFISHTEFLKGSGPMDGSLETDFTVLNNKTIIARDNYLANGSEVTQDSWIETDNGGFVWYLQSELDGRRRFEDRIEMGLLQGESAEAGSEAGAAGYDGSEGLFQSVRTRGNMFEGLATTIADFDTILKRFDAQGKIREYMFYVDRDQSLAIDDLLGELNAGYSGGISYGMFDNDEQMAINLGFRGFKRGSYNFYKSDWKILNDPTLLGAVDPANGKVRGLLVPHGDTEVYDGSSPQADRITKPYLSIKYRVKGSENRRHKTWITGSVGTNAPTDGNDHMRVHHLADRGVSTIGANNYMIFEGE